jgi:hypothetical protein
MTSPHVTVMMVRAVDDVPIVRNAIRDARNTVRPSSRTIPDARNAARIAVQPRRIAG